MTDEMLATLSTYIAKEVLKQPKRQIGPEDKLISSGLVDSFSLIDLSLFIEDTYGVHIDDTELNADNFDTLTELVNLIHQRQ